MSRYDYGAFIKSMRKEKNLTQADVACRMDISRTSYISIEYGRRNLTIDEAKSLSSIFNITLENLLNLSKDKNKKYEQMLFAVLRATKNTKKITKTKLAKILYLADFAWFYEHHESMSGMQYRKIEYGPVPDYYFSLIEELNTNGKINIDVKSGGAMIISQARAGERIGNNLLSVDEQKLINKIVKKWIDKSTNEIVGFTHSQIPYEFADYGEIIPYGFITQEDPKHVY